MEFETRTGTAAELREGDFIDTVGGKVGGRMYKRYRIEASVQHVYQTPGQRTRCQMRLTRLGTYTLRLDYPVNYRRPVTEA